MAEANAVILAAGLSTRMGERNKLLLDLGGTPMIRRVVQVYSKAIDGVIRVVTGFEAERIGQALSGLPVQIIHNPQFAQGQQTSVVAGLAKVSQEAPTILGLGDQPHLRPADLRWLMAQHEKAPEKITIPQNMTGARGNPIVIPRALRGQMLANPKSPGCRKFTRDNPNLVQMVPSLALGFFADIDTPEDYARIDQNLRVTVGGHA